MVLYRLFQYVTPVVIVVSVSQYYTEQIFWGAISAILAFTAFSYMREAYKGRFWLAPYLTGGGITAGFIYLDQYSLDQLFAHVSLGFLAFLAVASNQTWNRKDINLGRSVKLSEVRKEQRRMIKNIEKYPVTLDSLIETIQEFNSFDRERLEQEGYLNSPPRKGKGLISEKKRTKKGEDLLNRARLLLFALLYGDEETNVSIPRIQTELLSITVPRKKVVALLPFMRAVTEIGGRGTWIDPEGKSHDVTSDNIILEVVYWETESEMVGNGIKSCLLLINNLEINEQVLFFRMMNIEQTNLTL